MASYRVVVPFNGPFSSNWSASRFDVSNCGPSHTAICPSCNWWSLLATLHSALLSQPDINQKVSTQQHHVVFEVDSLTLTVSAFSYHIHHFKNTPSRQWSRGVDITLCHTGSTTFHKYILLNASLMHSRKHPVHITERLDELFSVPCVIQTSTTAIKHIKLTVFSSDCIFNYL